MVEGNESASRLYLGYGFRYTGTSEPLLSDASKLVKWMDLPLGAEAHASAPAPTA